MNRLAILVAVALGSAFSATGQEKQPSTGQAQEAAPSPAAKDTDEEIQKKLNDLTAKVGALTMALDRVEKFLIPTSVIFRVGLAPDENRAKMQADHYCRTRLPPPPALITVAHDLTRLGSNFYQFECRFARDR